MEEWLIPWKERSRSGPVNDNFLWRSDCLYVMDNHRLSLWCWWQHLNNESGFLDFVHIDRHYDATWQLEHLWLENFKPNHISDLGSFRQAKFLDGGDELSLYRWDVIVSALFTLNGNNIHNWVFATAGEGDAPSIPRMKFINPWNLPGQLNLLAQPNEEEYSAIIDIDIDYFTHFERNGFYGRVFSDQYISELNSALVKGLSNGRFEVVTVALSPTTTGSWQLAEELCWSLLDGVTGLQALQAGAP